MARIVRPGTRRGTLSLYFMVVVVVTGWHEPSSSRRLGGIGRGVVVCLRRLGPTPLEYRRRTIRLCELFCLLRKT